MRMAFSYHCMYFTSLGIFTTIGVQAVQMVALTTVVTLVGWKRLNSKNGFKKSVFLKHCNTLVGSKLLIFDGHVSHITLDIVEIAKENNISIIVLPPHTTNFLQQLDVAVFKPLKTEWRNVVGDYLDNNSFEN